MANQRRVIDDQTIYNLVCKQEFADLKVGQEKVLAVLKGENGNKGVCERVRNLERLSRGIVAVGIFFASVASIQLITALFTWIRQRIGN